MFQTYTHPHCKACSSLGAGHKERVSRPAIADCVIFFNYTNPSCSQLDTSKLFSTVPIQVLKHAAHWVQVTRRECLSLKSQRLPGLPSMPLLRTARQASSICTRPRKLCCPSTSFLLHVSSEGLYAVVALISCND